MLELRKVIYPQDCGWIWAIMNEPDVREVSHNTKSISYQDNLDYWRKFDGEGWGVWYDEKPVGILRLNNKLISIAVTKDYRNMGLGTFALKQLNLKGYKAEVKANNELSQKFFEKIGFTRRYIVYEKD